MSNDQTFDAVGIYVIHKMFLYRYCIIISDLWYVSLSHIKQNNNKFLSHNIMSIWILKVAGALTHDRSWSSIFLEGMVLTYSCQLPY
jgi:hypothetical protein